VRLFLEQSAEVSRQPRYTQQYAVQLAEQAE
jgi:hypothetical protein